MLSVMLKFVWLPFCRRVYEIKYLNYITLHKFQLVSAIIAVE